MPTVLSAVYSSVVSADVSSGSVSNAIFFSNDSFVCSETVAIYSELAKSDFSSVSTSVSKYNSLPRSSKSVISFHYAFFIASATTSMTCEVEVASCVMAKCCAADTTSSITENVVTSSGL